MGKQAFEKIKNQNTLLTNGLMGFIIPINPDERLVIKHEAMSRLGAVTRNHPFNSNIL
jgi:hypothetical protein